MTENGVAAVPPDEDRTPTQEDAPPIKPADTWVMPEPVFRRSDGYTPGGMRPGSEDETLMPDAAEDSGDAAADGSPAPIAEQPHLSEEPATGDEVSEPSEPIKAKRGFVRVLLVILGVGALILIAAAIVFAVVFWYFFQVSESQNLN